MDTSPLRDPTPGSVETSAGIHAPRKLNPSGIILRSNGTYDLEAVDVVDWRDWTIPTTPDGFTRWYLWPAAWTRRVPRAPWFALIGQIGDAARTRFVVGSRRTGYTPPIDGELVLFANDASFAYGNNRGSLKVEVRRTR